MSRPPHPRRATSTTGTPLPGRRVLDYLEHELADFVELERALAAEELGFPPSTSEGDFAGTLMEVSALIAHVLGVYQDRFANEAFLGTAQSPKSLAKHGRRLAYEPSPGMSAAGHVVLWAKEGLRGTIPKGFAIGSAPRGEKKAQDYELLDDVEIAAEHDERFPASATEAVDLSSASSLVLEGTQLDLGVGEHVLVRWGTATVKRSAHRIEAVVEDDATSRTTVTLEPKLTIPAAELVNVRLLGKPAERRHLFGWNSSITTFPDQWLRLDGSLSSTAKPTSDGDTLHGYTQPTWITGSDLFLDAELAKSLDGAPILRLQQKFVGGKPTIEASAFEIEQQTKTPVAFKWITNQTITINTSPTASTFTNYPTASISGTVTALRVKDAAGEPVPRTTQQIRASEWLLDFQLDVPVVTARPSTVPLARPLVLVGATPDLAPGRLLALTTLEAAGAPTTEIVRLVTAGVDEAAGTTSITWTNVDPAISAGTFTLGNVRVLGNVARISHGKTITEVLGGSDGITPHLRFPLAKTPLTYLPSAEGGTPALEVRVADVRWDRVEDLESSTEHDRVYVLLRDEAGVVTIVFGDGKKGAIPSSGKRHIHATYRIGVGADGNADVGLVSRIKKAHPVLERAFNPRPVRGGVDPANAEVIRQEATSLVKTLDRAVSVEDYENLASRYPGVRRARAHTFELPGTSVLGVRLVVADAEGKGIDVAPLRQYLDARRDQTVPLELVDPVSVDVVVALSLEIDPAYEAQAVERAVGAALVSVDERAPGLLSFLGRGLGQPLFASEVVERVQGIAGVAYVRLSRLDLASLPAGSTPRVLDTIAIDPGRWLRLLPTNLSLASQEPSS